MTPDENALMEQIAMLQKTVQQLARAFDATGDVTMQEFQSISQSRDDLSALIVRMYERCIYKDD